MKSLFAGLALSSLATPLASAASLDLTVNNVETADGALMIAVFDGEDGWKSNASVRGAMADPATGSVSVTIEGLAPGEYGVKLYHDTDGDGDLDTGRFGIPSEPYGFSNDAPVRFGPPSWKKAKFTVTEGENAQTITLR